MMGGLIHQLIWVAYDIVLLPRHAGCEAATKPTVGSDFFGLFEGERRVRLMVFAESSKSYSVKWQIYVLRYIEHH